MAINKQCFYKSMKSDYMWMGKGVLVIAGIIFVIVFGTKVIEAAATSSIPASTTTVFLLAITAAYLLHSIAFESVGEAKHEKVYRVIPFGWSLMFLMWIISLAPYAFFINVVEVPKLHQQNFLIESVIELIVIGIIYAVITPVCLAYARCKEPGTVERGTQNGN